LDKTERAACGEEKNNPGGCGGIPKSRGKDEVKGQDKLYEERGEKKMGFLVFKRKQLVMRKKKRQRPGGMPVLVLGHG